MIGLVYIVLSIISVLLALQGGYTLYLMIYTWDDPRVTERTRAPERFSEPSLSFTVMLPARHEEEVIQTTMGRVVGANYPAELIQVLVICSADDTGTIQQAERKVEELRLQNRRGVDLVVFDDRPINKPHALNTALRYATKDVVTVFDAEDDVHPDIFNVVNTVMLQDPVKVVQAGVQLMNYRDRWYSALNVLEYFFWFKSTLHFFARYGAIPLGGNTVFFRRAVLHMVGGWDERNLTEDADIGIRLSSVGVSARVVYDDRYVTREETPPTLGQFIKQRTRWSQGFLQTLRKGDWRRMPGRAQRLLAAYTLTFPIVQAALGLYAVAALIMMFEVKAPIMVALISYLPVLLLASHFLTAVIGLREFTEAYGMKASWGMTLNMALAWFPYQLVLAFAALRAVGRIVLGVNNWEKTKHVGAHRQRQEAGEHAA
ncbi:MAG TPA: glycosyltransferase [Candidatus Dormibacteraeota bacterium]|nr:glycosyltransferase [Candidatus Dormibacteraeota bacterium]